MPLDSGAHLGPYEILAPLGAGGMGEVYKARDTRLDRIVAVKILASHLSSSTELRQRFEREARSISSLNHPHICVLHDIGHHEGTDFLVMEYLEGETLAERLTRGPLPTDQIFRYAVEIADALDRAHRQGIIHRDLKPGNIMLTKSGAKLLDFGLAKLRGPELAVGGPSALPTQQQSVTAEGTVVGTFQYMGPEQVEGREADARTDIFAFGAVLYEMATGHKAFEGKNQASLIAAILERNPRPISELQPMAPPALDHMIRTCLAKDPDERWQTAHDVTVQLKWIAEGGSQAGIPAPVVARRKTRERLWIAAAVVGTLAALTLAATTVYFYRAQADVRPISFSVYPPPKGNWAGSVFLSPDGQRLLFRATDAEGRAMFWVRKIDSLEAQPLTSTEDGSTPFWSADSRFVAFFAQGKLKKAEASGGPAQTLCDAVPFGGGSWNSEGVILFGNGDVIHRVSASGGVPAAMTALDRSRQEVSHYWPQFLPDGRHFLFAVRSAQRENNAIYAGSLDSKETKRILATDSRAIFTPSGYLLFMREQALMAQPFDPKGLKLKKEPILLADSVSAFAASENGVLAYRSGDVGQNTQLAWFDRAGKQLGTLGQPGTYWNIDLSQDEKKVAVEQTDTQTSTSDIWVIEKLRGIASRFTFDPSNDSAPVWSSDQSRIIFSSNRGGTDDLFQKVSSGGGKEELLLKSDYRKFCTDCSLDGKLIVYNCFDPRTKWDLWVLPLSGDRKPAPLLQTEFNEHTGRFSPDGRWLAYVSNESKREEIYVQPFPPTGAKFQISTKGGSAPRWRGGGNELFYISPDKKIMAVRVKTATSTLEADLPEALFDARAWNNAYDVSSDGQRFLIVTPAGETATVPITVVVNWPAKFAPQ